MRLPRSSQLAAALVLAALLAVAGSSPAWGRAAAPRAVTDNPRAFQWSGVEGGLFAPAARKRTKRVYGAVRGGRGKVAASTSAAATTSPMPTLDTTSPGAVTTIRNNLVQYIWKGAGFPTGIPDTIQTGISDSAYSGMTNLQRIDKYTVNMELGVSTYSYLFRPVTSANKLIVVWNGHDGTPAVMKSTIQFFLGKGYTVLEGWMPLQPEYPASTKYPVVQTRDFGTFTLWSHYYLSWVDSDTLSPIKFFVDPVAKDLNFVLSQNNYAQVAMMGLSGGGWTTTLYAALDPRIQKSYPVAGSQPFYLRNDYNPGDWEQYVGGLYHVAEYMEMYVLGSYGSGRNQLQILNSNDTCCFSGQRYLSYPYESTVQSQLSTLGAGRFNVYIDQNNAHSITTNALNQIAADLGA